MNQIAAPIFQALFQSAVPRIILAADAPDFTIIDYNKAHQQATANRTDDHRGQSIWTAYEPRIAGSDGPALLKNALISAISSASVVKMPVFRYDIFQQDGKAILPCWWQLEIMPVADEQGEIAYLLVTTHNVTDEVQRDRRSDELHEELLLSSKELALANDRLNATLQDLQEANQVLERFNLELESRVERGVKAIAQSESSLHSLVMTAHYPLMILRGKNWVIEHANQALVNLWEKTIEDVTGQELMDVLPELVDQPFPAFLRQVYESGVGYGQEEQIFYYNSPSGPATKYVSFYYDPLVDENGLVLGIIVSADDITAKVEQRQLLERSLANEQSLVEETSSLNDELAATVEELSATNEELMDAQDKLAAKHDELVDSEERFRLLIRQAPVGICVIRASDLLVVEVNDNYLELVGKTRQELENKLIWDAVAEAATDYAPIMDEVIHSGKAFVATEHQLLLVRFGEPEIVFVDFVYEPVIAASGTVTAIMVVAINVTEKVNARKTIEEASARMQLAVEAAEMGTFEFSYENNEVVTSERFNEIFNVVNPKSRSELLRFYHPEDLHLSAQAHVRAARDGKMLYEARIIHADQSVHWIKVQANVIYNSDGEASKLMGTILDISDSKRLQQQKDDFISIASHELKTPITSLKASLQLLMRMQDPSAGALFTRLLSQANRSMERINALVEDLLNVGTIGSEAVKLNKTTFTLKTLLDECCTHIRESDRHELIFEGDALLQVTADENRIEQVVVNFVNNAVKYAPNSKKIYLIVDKQGDYAKVSVRDNGNGIPLEKQKLIFDRYVRADSNSLQIAGLGLGLYISADIIHRHHGEIGVDSTPGQGATFWFTLPIVSI